MFLFIKSKGVYLDTMSNAWELELNYAEGILSQRLLGADLGGTVHRFRWDY